MSQYFVVHNDDPQKRYLEKACESLKGGGIIVYPTDTTYALACHLGDKDAVDRIRQIRRLDDKHHFTLMCQDLKEISSYANVNNAAFRLLKRATPGPFTFLLPATKEVPKRLQHPKKKTVGLRVPDNKIVLSLLALHGEPLMTTTLQLPGDEYPMQEAYKIKEALEHQVDVILDGGMCGLEQTTVVSLESDDINIVRAGVGDIDLLN